MNRVLAALVVLTLGFGCAAEPEPEPVTPEPTPEAPADGGSMFASAADEIVVKEKPNLGVLTAGEEKEEPAKQQTAARAGGTTTSGGRTVTQSQVKAVIKAKMPQIKACYERELKNDEGLRGKVVVGWTIQANGSVSGLRTVRNSTRNSSLSKCIIQNVSRWSFPRAEASLDIEYPFSFKPRDW